MKKETRTFPLENLVSIEIDRENGMALAMYEESKPLYEIGKWYQCGGCLCLRLGEYRDGETNAVGFAVNKWNPEMVIIADDWQPANMLEVEELLVKEAEKRGFKEGVTIKSVKHERVSTSEPYLAKGIGLICSTLDGWITILNFTTGKWATIIEEKKPLYVNPVTREEFYNDEFAYWVFLNKENVYKLECECVLCDLNKCALKHDKFTLFKNKEKAIAWADLRNAKSRFNKI